MYWEYLEVIQQDLDTTFNLPWSLRQTRSRSSREIPKKERCSGSFHLQLSSWISKIVSWLSSFQSSLVLFVADQRFLSELAYQWSGYRSTIVISQIFPFLPLFLWIRLWPSPGTSLKKSMIGSWGAVLWCCAETILEVFTWIGAQLAIVCLSVNHAAQEQIHTEPQ